MSSYSSRSKTGGIVFKSDGYDPENEEVKEFREDPLRNDDTDDDDDDDSGNDGEFDKSYDELEKSRVLHILRIKELYDMTIKMLRSRSPSYGVDLYPAANLSFPPDTPPNLIAKRFEELVNYYANPTISSTIQQAFSREVMSLRVILSQIIPRGVVGEKLMLFFAERGTVRNMKTTKHMTKKQVSTKLINAFLSALAIAKSQGENITEVIIITPVPIPIDRNGFSMMNMQRGFFLQVFTDSEIYTPVANSIIASRYQLYAGRELKEYLKSQGLEGREANLPQINHNDPALKYLGARPGQIAVITRPPIHAMSPVSGGITIKKIVAGSMV